MYIYFIFIDCGRCTLLWAKDTKKSNYWKDSTKRNYEEFSHWRRHR